MVELVAAFALAPWAQPLRFQPLTGWHTGASGTFDSSYGPVPGIASPRESTAWMARGVRYRDRPTADPPEATLSRLPPQGIVVFAVVYQSALTSGRIRAEKAFDPIRATSPTPARARTVGSVGPDACLFSGQR